MLSVDIANPLNYKEVYNNQIHQSRVMGIWIDGASSRVYSISEDRTIKVIDYKIKEILADVMVSSSKLCKLVVDDQSKTGFISDRCGLIHIFDLVPIAPKFIQVISTPSNKGALRGLQIDMNSSN